MRIYENGTYRDLTAEEIAAMQEAEAKAAAQEKHRPLTESEVSRILITEQINTLAVDDQTALRMTEFYPVWAVGVTYAVGYRLQHNGKLYRVLTAHTSQADWSPDVAVTLFVRIDEEHDGSKYDPIPYDGNMALVSSLYYTQDGVLYRCTRDTGTPVYHDLRDLVGLYVDIV